MKIWRILLVCFLVLYGFLLISNLKFESQNLLLGLAAIAAGIFLACDK